MQANQQIVRPTDPSHIHQPGTPEELWWTGSEWSKPPVVEGPLGPKLDQIVQVWSAIRDARAAKRQVYEAEDLQLESDQQTLKAIMLDLLNKQGAQSVVTGHGTVYKSLKVKPSAADWSEVYRWIGQDPERFEMLEKRLKSTFVSQYMEDNEGVAPPGVNVIKEYEVAVRRPKAPPAA